MNTDVRFATEGAARDFAATIDIIGQSATDPVYDPTHADPWCVTVFFVEEPYDEN